MSAREIAERFSRDVHRIVIGQDETVRLAFIALTLGGHLLIEGVPGTAKTLLARTVAHLIGGTFKRIQFTPDLMPSDIVARASTRSAPASSGSRRARSSRTSCSPTR